MPIAIVLLAARVWRTWLQQLASLIAIMLAVGKRLPHICFVAPYAYPVLVGDEHIELVGGAEVQQTIVAKSLAKLGYPVSMVCLNFGQNDQVQIDGITVYRAYRPSEGVPILRFVWPRLTSIWGCLTRVDADIYYQRTAGMLTGVVAAFCQRKSKKSIFAMASNSDLLPNPPMIRYRRDRWLYEYGLKHVDRIFVQNLEQANLCRQKLAREAVLIPNCYPLPEMRSSQLGQSVLWVSTILTLKRPELFLGIAEALQEYQFIMVGGPAAGEERLFRSIRHRAEYLSNVSFTGFVPYSKVDEYFDNAALLINTSDTEGFPNTFLQAWSRGIPTVSFVDCGARVDGQVLSGQVDSLEEMRDEVVRLMSDAFERSNAGAKCRVYVEQHHSLTRVIHLYQEAFDDLFRS